MQRSKLIAATFLGVGFLINTAQAATECQPSSPPWAYRYCQDFEEPPPDFCARTASPPPPPSFPAVVDSGGKFLRVIYDEEFSHFSSAAFDRVAPGAYPRIVAEFDFRLYGPDEDDDGDGIAFLLIPTSDNGTTGCSTYSHSMLFVEKPAIANTFGVGFDIFTDDPHTYDHIHLCWDGSCVDRKFGEEAGEFHLEGEELHRARVDIRKSGSGSLVSVTLIQDVHGAEPGSPIPVFQNHFFEGMQPYENRIDFAGRNGGLNVSGDVDNIDVRWVGISVPTLVPALSIPGLAAMATLLLLMGTAAVRRR